jgi:hypothetical protein
MFHIGGRSQRNRCCFRRRTSAKVRGAQVRSQQAAITCGPGATLGRARAERASIHGWTCDRWTRRDGPPYAKRRAPGDHRPYAGRRTCSDDGPHAHGRTFSNNWAYTGRWARGNDQPAPHRWAHCADGAFARKRAYGDDGACTDDDALSDGSQKRFSEGRRVREYSLQRSDSVGRPQRNAH